MKRHMLVEKRTDRIAVKCGQVWEPRKLPTTEGWTGWWRQVSCAACVDAMGLSPEHRAQLDATPR